MPELPLDEDQRMPGGEPSGRRGVPERVQRHVPKPGVLEGPFMPIVCRPAIRWDRLGPPGVAAAEWGRAEKHPTAIVAASGGTFVAHLLQRGYEPRAYLH